MSEIPKKVHTWIEAKVFPQRVLFSASHSVLEEVIEIAARLQETTPDRIKNGLHADTVLFRDIGKSFKVDFSDTAKKEGQTETENARGILDWATKKPVAPYRIIILENIERAGNSAINALLKIIEEPPRKTLFLFTTKNHHKLLDTVLSRVITVRVPKKSQDFLVSDEIRAFLEGKNILQSFRKIEALDKESKNNPEKKINRSVIYRFLEECIQHAQLFDHLQPKIKDLFEAHRSISQNMSIKFTLEFLALKLQKNS